MRAMVCVMLALVLAGCSAGQANSEDGPTGPNLTADSAAVDGETGGVEGLVVDGEQAPVPQATISLVPSTLTAETALDGRFAIGNVPPGEYTLHVTKLGYEAAAKKISVVAGEVVTHTFIIDAIAIVEPRHETFGPFQGYMQCRMATILSSGACGFIPVVGNTPVTSVWTNDKVLWDFGKFSGEDWENIVFESKWTPSTAATNPKMNQIFSHQNRTSTQWWSDSGGQASPIQFVYNKEDGGPGGQIPSGTASKDQKPGMQHMLRTWITLPFGTTSQPVEVAYEMKFQMMVTIYYSDTPPENYSAFPDE